MAGIEKRVFMSSKWNVMQSNYSDTLTVHVQVSPLLELLKMEEIQIVKTGWMKVQRCHISWLSNDLNTPMFECTKHVCDNQKIRTDKMYNIELHNSYSSPNTVKETKWRRMRWVEHVARMRNMRNAYKIVARKPDGKRLVGRPWNSCEDNVKKDRKDTGCDDVGQRRALVNTVMNLRVPQKVGISWPVERLSDSQELCSCYGLWRAVWK